MPDICMCQNEKCELRFECFRFSAVPNPWRQSYFLQDPAPVDGKCEHFMKIFTPSAYDIKPLNEH